MQATKLFYCYAHKDKSLQNRLTEHLASLKREGLIAESSDRDIIAGQEWQKEIDKHLKAADIILLLISPDFISSDYCYTEEMFKALELHRTGNARVIPIILRPVDWEKMPFGQFQALPTNGKPITTWENRDKAFLDVAQGVRKVIETILPVSDECPYLDLKAFTRQDHERFFGRERAVETVLKRLESSPHFLALLGPSGSGKSSLIQAGVVKELCQGMWLGVGERLDPITSRPGSDPFAELTLQGLPGTSMNLSERIRDWRGKHPEKERLVLIIDQFEEVWTLCSPKIAQDFTGQVVALVKAPESAYTTLILIMRDDFLPHVQRHVALAQLIESSRVWVPPTLRRIELTAIVQEPANAQRLRFAEGLVETIIEDVLRADSTEVEGEIVAYNTILPLLELALTRLWHQRQNREMTREAYDKIGRVSGGLTVWANNTFLKLDERLQPLARAIFTKLIHVGDESQNILHSRRRRTLTSLYPEQKDTHAVIARLAEARLLMTSRDPRSGEASVEIIHDVLLRKWKLLRDWIAEDRIFLAWRQEFEKRLQLWIETDPNDALLRDEGRLLGGRDLDDAEHWMAEHALDFDLTPQDFVTISRKHVERQHQALIARQLAVQAETVQNQKAYFLQRSMLLAVEAMLHFPCLEADQALRSRLAMFPRPMFLLHHHDLVHFDDVHAIAFSPDGRYLVTGGRDYTARVWEVSTGREIIRVNRDRGLFEPGISPLFETGHAVAFSPDGQRIASAGEAQMAHVWRAVDGREIAVMDHKGGYVLAVAFSPDGSYLATASGDCTARIWNVESGEETARLTHDDVVRRVTFSPDGHYLATGSRDNTTQVWDTSSREVVTRITLGGTMHDQEELALNAIAFSPDSRYLAIGGKKGTLRGIVEIWETNSLSKIAHNIELERDPDLGFLRDTTVNALAFSPDSTSLAAATNGRAARLWKVTTGKQLQRFVHKGGEWGSSNEVYAVAFSPDGHYLATTGWDGTTGIWDAYSGHQIACLTGGIHLHAVAFSPDGHYLATAGRDGARIWEMPVKSGFVCFHHDGPVYAVAASPDGHYLATGSQDGARLWKSINDQKKGEKTTIKSQPEAILPHEGHVSVVAFSPDGRYLATAGGGNTKIWQLPDAVLIASLPHVARDIAFSPDSRYLASGGWLDDNANAHVWVMPDGLANLPLEHKGGLEAVAFSPDGRRLATVGQDDTAKIWDVTTGRCKASLIHDDLKDTLDSGQMLRDVIFSPDGRYLVTAGGGSNRGSATLWNVANGSKAAHFMSKVRIWMVAFSPDGRYLVTAGDDSRAHIWEVPSGRQLASLAHEHTVYAVAFSHDGNYLATASWDGTAGVWEVPGGRQLARVSHENKVNAAIFSQDDKYLITASEDGTAKGWLWKPHDMITEASFRLTYDLTPEEWRTYMGDEPYRKTRHCPLQEPLPIGENNPQAETDLPAVTVPHRQEGSPLASITSRGLSIFHDILTSIFHDTVPASKLQSVKSKDQENKPKASEEGVNLSSENDEIGLLTTQIRQGHPTRSEVERLKQYGVACLERLIKETKTIKGGDQGRARDEVFTSMDAEDAFPTALSLMDNNDRDMRQVVALSLCRFKYQDVHKIDDAIEVIRYVLRRAQSDDSSEGDKWRLDHAIDILYERRETEFNTESEKQVQMTATQTTVKSDEKNQSNSVQERQAVAQSKSDSALLTEQAKRVILFAEKAARSFQHNYIGTEHLLLGLLDEQEGEAGKLLNELGVESEKARSTLELITGHGDKGPSSEIGLTPRARKVLELASNEARRLNHQSLSTEHLLLGLVIEGESSAAGILESLGINLEKLRHMTITRLNQRSNVLNKDNT